MNLDPTALHGWRAAAAGALLGLSLAAPPGPVMAVMAEEALRGRTRAALATAAGAMTADATWLTLAVLGAITWLAARPRLVGAFGIAGGLLLMWMAYLTWRDLHRPPVTAPAAARGSFRLGYATVLTSPFSFAWWFANGAVLWTAWGAPGICGLFAALVAYSVAFVEAFRWLGRRTARVARGLAWVSVVMLAGFGAIVLLRGWTLLR